MPYPNFTPEELAGFAAQAQQYQTQVQQAPAYTPPPVQQAPAYTPPPVQQAPVQYDTSAFNIPQFDASTLQQPGMLTQQLAPPVPQQQYSLPSGLLTQYQQSGANQNYVPPNLPSMAEMQAAGAAQAQQQAAQAAQAQAQADQLAQQQAAQLAQQQAAQVAAQQQAQTQATALGVTPLTNTYEASTVEGTTAPTKFHNELGLDVRPDLTGTEFEGAYLPNRPTGLDATEADIDEWRNYYADNPEMHALLSMDEKSDLLFWDKLKGNLTEEELNQANKDLRAEYGFDDRYISIEGKENNRYEWVSETGVGTNEFMADDIQAYFEANGQEATEARFYNDGAGPSIADQFLMNHENVGGFFREKDLPGGSVLQDFTQYPLGALLVGLATGAIAEPFLAGGTAAGTTAGAAGTTAGTAATTAGTAGTAAATAGGLGLSGTSLAAAQAALANAVVTGVSGGDFGDIAQSALTGAVTSGIGGMLEGGALGDLSLPGMDSTLGVWASENPILSAGLTAGGVSALAGNDLSDAAISALLGSGAEYLRYSGLETLDGEGLFSDIANNTLDEFVNNQILTGNLSVSEAIERGLISTAVDAVSGTFGGDSTETETETGTEVTTETASVDPSMETTNVTAADLSGTGNLAGSILNSTLDSNSNDDELEEVTVTATDLSGNTSLVPSNYTLDNGSEIELEETVVTATEDDDEDSLVIAGTYTLPTGEVVPLENVTVTASEDDEDSSVIAGTYTLPTGEVVELEETVVTAEEEDEEVIDVDLDLNSDGDLDSDGSLDYDEEVLVTAPYIPPSIIYPPFLPPDIDINPDDVILPGLLPDPPPSTDSSQSSSGGSGLLGGGGAGSFTPFMTKLNWKRPDVVQNILLPRQNAFNEITMLTNRLMT